jgi:hypothetical protein
MKDDISILINSCDKYSDVWEVFFPLFFKYWPDCPWKIYLGSNEKVYKDPRVNTICVGKDKSWADSALSMINKIPTKNIMFFLDDFFIFWKVNTKKVNHYYNVFTQLDANYMRLRNSPFSNKPVDGYPDLVLREKGEMYRTALDIAFWKKEVFMDLLVSGENPWQMEIEGSKRSCKYDGFYTTKEWVIERRNGLEAGKWMRYNLDLIKKEGLIIPKGHKIRSAPEELIVVLHTYLWTLSAYKFVRKLKTTISRNIKNVILRNK